MTWLLTRAMWGESDDDGKSLVGNLLRDGWEPFQVYKAEPDDLIYFKKWIERKDD